MKIYAILHLGNKNLFSKRQILSNQEAQSRAPSPASLCEAKRGGRQIAEGLDGFRDLSQACSAWDFFAEFRKMPRTERQKMFRIPRSSRFVVYENEKKPFDMCQMDKDMNKLIFTRVLVVSKNPFIARIVRVEKEVITQ